MFLEIIMINYNTSYSYNKVCYNIIDISISNES